LAQQKRICATAPFQERDIGYIVLPDQVVTKPYDRVNVPRKEIDVNANGESRMWVVGCINYWDTIQEKVRQTSVCQSFNNTAPFKPTGIVKGTFTPYFLWESGN